MSEPHTNIEAIRAEIDNLSSPDFRILSRYVEALHAEQTNSAAQAIVW